MLFSCALITVLLLVNLESSLAVSESMSQLSERLERAADRLLQTAEDSSRTTLKMAETIANSSVSGGGIHKVL
jgi:hypothetical protein